MFPLRAIRQCAAVSSRKHAEQHSPCESASDWHPGPVSRLPSTPAALLPPQHQHGVPAQRPITLPGNRIYTQHQCYNTETKYNEKGLFGLV